MIERPCDCTVNLLDQTFEGTEVMHHADKIRVLTNAVCTAKNQFEHYADLHDRKGTPESAEKATVNRELAKQMGDALTETGGSPS